MSQTALLAQIQVLTNTIQSLNPNSNNISNILLATHDYLASERKTRNSRTTPYENRPVGRTQKESTNKGLDEKLFAEEPEEEQENISEQDMEEAGSSNLNNAKIVKKTIHKKKEKAALPVLATIAESYDILEDLAQQKANITVTQLIQTSPAQRTQLSK